MFVTGTGRREMINTRQLHQLGLTIYHLVLPLPDSQNLANNTLAITNLNNLTGAKSKKTPGAAE